MKSVRSVHIITGIIFIAALFAIIPPETIYKSLKCSFVGALDSDTYADVDLLDCSNKKQSIDFQSFQNIDNVPADVPGWSILSPRDKSLPGVFLVTLKVSGSDSDFIFYPRIEGPSDSIQVFEDRRYPSRLFSLSKKAKGWTPIGAQYSVCRSCFEADYTQTKSYQVTLKITLYGDWAQVWHKDGKVFF